MMDTELEAQITAATAYEDFFVTALCGQWAPLVVEATGIISGDRVLDVACGTGVLAREAFSHVAPNGFVSGLQRLAEVKAKWDPENFFRTNRNIAPA